MAKHSPLTQACTPALPAEAVIHVFGQAPQALLGELRIAQQHPAATPPQSPCDLAVFIEPFVSAPIDTVRQHLAAARDRHAKQVLVVLAAPNDAHQREQFFFALGFVRRSLSPEFSEQFKVYGFALANYKRTPDWLNAKYWAHPERWGRR